MGHNYATNEFQMDLSLNCWDSGQVLLQLQTNAGYWWGNQQLNLALAQNLLEADWPKLLPLGLPIAVYAVLSWSEWQCEEQYWQQKVQKLLL